MFKHAQPRRIVILGGTGFVGQRLVSALHDEGHRIKVLSRNREAHRDLLVLPQVEIVTANIFNPESLAKHFERADIVINLVGILNESGHRGRGFQRAHFELTTMAANAARKSGATRYLQMSALGADPNGPSHYLRSKGRAEDFLMQQAKDLDVTIFQPSVIFGPDDSFLNRFAGLLKIAPVFPLACASARFAPVYVEDVVAAFCSALHDADSIGQRYELCGPRIYTLRELVSYVRRQLGLRRLILPLPKPLSWLQAAVFEFIPGKPFSLDNYNSTKTDSVCRNSDGLRALGITPTPLEGIAPAYLRKHVDMRNRYDDYRQHARPDRD
ncbi:MAG: complex I NDUFA9 subunit family protein [Gammaproteobacteria bacterium]|nr:complex I NDUFA9 subunit family protein [Gammaproteobacteria bacterium]